MSKITQCFSLILYVLFALSPVAAYAQAGSSSSDPILISTQEELLEINNATSTPVYYQLTNDIVLDNTITSYEVISIADGRSVYIDGAGFELSAYITGTNEQGIVNADASYYNMFDNQGELFLSDLTIKGGARSAISNRSTLTMERCVITQSGSRYFFGGGLNNNGIARLTDTGISRNVADAGGGFFSKGTLILENCIVTENRNIGGGARGGGGGENGGSLYACNTTFSNNQSTEIGGGINNCWGNLYLVHCSITGNISQNGDGADYGGGIGFNGGSLNIANSVIKDNYATNNRGEFVPSDMGQFDGSISSQTIVNCLYGAVCTSSDGTTTDLPDGMGNINTTDDQFLKYETTVVYNADGTIDETLSGLRRPVLVQGYPLLVPGSVSTTDGIDVYMDLSDLSNIKMGYATDTDIKKLTSNAPNDGDQVDVFANGDSRGSSNTVIGALGQSFTTYYGVKVEPAENGSVKGGTIFGDYYEAGTDITLSAKPDEGYELEGFYDNDMNPLSTSSDYSFTLNEDVTIKVVFRIKPLVPLVYHNITLEVAPGIKLNGITAGDFEVLEGEDLYLLFLPEDSELTAQDVSLLIDGVETDFKDLGGDYFFSYNLMSIQGNHIIRIVLKEKEAELPGSSTSNLQADDSAVRIYTESGTLYIENAAKGTALNIYTISGQLITRRTLSDAFTAIPLSSGIYIVRVGEKGYKINCKL